jgi:hypothetical protein
LRDDKRHRRRTFHHVEVSEAAGHDHVAPLVARTASKRSLLDRPWASGAPHFRSAGRCRHPHGRGKRPTVSATACPSQTRPPSHKSLSRTPPLGHWCHRTHHPVSPSTKGFPIAALFGRAVLCAHGRPSRQILKHASCFSLTSLKRSA